MTSHPHNTEYAPPVLRASSPASSIGTTYGEDQTSFSDTEGQTSQTDFERKCVERLELRKPMLLEQIMNQNPLLPRPQNPAEGQAACDKIMRTLRFTIHQLEENEMFEQSLFRGSQVALTPQPSTDDVDALMRSMMGPNLRLSMPKSQNLNLPSLMPYNGVLPVNGKVTTSAFTGQHSSNANQ